MLTRQQKIDAIYEKIANKELSFGCRFKVENFNICYEFWYDVFETEWVLFWICLDTSIYGVLEFKVEKAIPYDKELWELEIDNEAIEDEYDFSEWDEDLKIIGHPVMIGDVMEYFYGSVRFSEWAKCWKKLTKPIEEQSDECIDFIYNLISKQWEK